MQKPQESLDDFFNRIEPVATEPPVVVSLRPTGEFETLKPLARWEWPAIPAPVGEEIPVPAPYRLSWFHRSLVFGGAVAVIGLVFLSAVFIAMNDPADQVAAVVVDNPGYESEDAGAIDDALVPYDEAEPSDIFSSANSPLIFGELRRIRPTAKPRRIRPRAERAAYKPRRRIPAPKSFVSDFVPTTLIIYAENGEIKTRIEPNLTAAYKRPTSLAN